MASIQIIGGISEHSQHNVFIEMSYIALLSICAVPADHLTLVATETKTVLRVYLGAVPLLSDFGNFQV
jgi:hypothetical protein